MGLVTIEIDKEIDIDDYVGKLSDEALISEVEDRDLEISESDASDLSDEEIAEEFFYRSLHRKGFFDEDEILEMLYSTKSLTDTDKIKSFFEKLK